MGQTGDVLQTLQLSVSRVLPDQFDLVWSAVGDAANGGFRHGAGDTITPEEIQQAVIAGRMEMWAVHDVERVVAAVVIQVVNRPKGKVLLVVLVAGRDFASWGQTVQDLLVEYAGLIGAVSIEAVARAGMAKWLSNMGWSRKATVMELKNGR